MSGSASLRVPAKLNWDLRVLGRRADGYHLLRSWFVGAGWYDRLSWTPARALESRPEAGDRPARLDVEGPCAAGVPTDARNLVLLAEDAWRRAGGAAPRVRWRLDKQLPHGAGLGGGSGDAAAALVLLQQAASRALPQGPLHAVAATLGADVPWFLGVRRATLQGGIGDRRLAEAAPPAPWVVLAAPAVLVPTADVYRAFQPAHPGTAAASDSRPSARPGPNDLSAAARKVAPELAAFAEALRAQGDFVQSGSGGTHFAACADEAAARALADAVAPLCEHAVAAPLLGGPADAEAARPLLCP